MEAKGGVDNIKSLVAYSHVSHWNKLDYYYCRGLFHHPGGFLSPIWQPHYYVLNGDDRVGIAFGLVSGRSFFSEWTLQIDDQPATPVYVDLLYENLIIATYDHVYVGANRYLLPLPNSLNDKDYFSLEKFEFGRVLFQLSQLGKAGPRYSEVVKSTGLSVL